MPNRLEKINNDLKKAMRGKDKLTVSVLRLLISAVHNKEISLRKGGRVDLGDEQIIEVIKSEIKKRKDSIEAYSEGGRVDLAEKEEKEKTILEKYLPPQMSEEELEKTVREIISSIGEINEKDFGKVMGQVMGKVKRQADGNRVSEAVKKVLNEKKN